MTEHNDIEQWYNGLYRIAGNTVRRHPKSYKVFFRYLNLGSDNNMIDVGCGAGELLALARRKYKLKPYGIDISKEALKLASENLAEGEFKQAKAEDLPFPDNPFDNVVLAKKAAGFPDEHFRRGGELFLDAV